MRVFSFSFRADWVECGLSFVGKEHPKCKELLDCDGGSGSGVFMPELEQPDLCNAHSTCLFELHLLTVLFDDVTCVFVVQLQFSLLSRQMCTVRLK